MGQKNKTWQQDNKWKILGNSVISAALITSLMISAPVDCILATIWLISSSEGVDPFS